jgi:hypothetical protein
MCRRVFGCFGCLVLVLLGAALFVWWDLTRSEPRLPPAATAPPSPTDERDAEAAIKRIERQIQPPRTNSPARARKEQKSSQEVRLSEREVNQMIRGLPEVRDSLKKARVSGTYVDFNPDEVVVGARVPLPGGASGRVTASGRIAVEDGRLVFHTTDLRLGSLPAPAALKKLLGQQIDAGMKELNESIEGRLKDVQVTGQELVVKLARSAPRSPGQPR